MTKQIKGFIPITRQEIASGATSLGYDLFSLDLTEIDQEPQLLCRQGEEISTVLTAMDSRLLAHFYIRQQDLLEYYNEREASLGTLLDNPAISEDEKSQALYSCASHVMEDVYTNPRSGRNLERTKDITNHLIKFSLASKGSVPGLLRLSSHDYYTFTHCVNVAVFAVGLMERITNLPEHDLYDFALGCILHDVGKTKVNETILNKPGRLTPKEFDIIKTHPQAGYALMKDSLPPIALDVILHHHERYDGTGYPAGLEEKSISDYSRVAIIADVYDALTTNRPYADAREPFKALMLMKQKMVGHFEEQKFAAFVEFLSQS